MIFFIGFLETIKSIIFIPIVSYIPINDVVNLGLISTINISSPLVMMSIPTKPYNPGRESLIFDIRLIIFKYR